MSASSSPTSEGLKEKAKVIRKFLCEKYNADISHGHCMELISQLFGFKDWNTASAALRPKVSQVSVPFEIRTVGEMREALAGFKDSDLIDGMYEFKFEDFMSQMDGNAYVNDVISQEFSFVLEDLDDGKAEPRIASFKLRIEHEELYSSDESGFSGRTLR